MSEEEKEAIEELKETIKYINKNGSMYCDNEDKDNMRILLNLIEKQQKEIEELGDRKAENYYHWKHLEAKIINKIEGITSYAYTSAEERDCQDYAIQALKELLGE